MLSLGVALLAVFGYEVRFLLELAAFESSLVPDFVGGCKLDGVEAVFIKYFLGNRKTVGFSGPDQNPNFTRGQDRLSVPALGTLFHGTGLDDTADGRV